MRYPLRALLVAALSLFIGTVYSQPGGVDCADATQVTAGTYNAAGPDVVLGTATNSCATGATLAEWYYYVPVGDQEVTITACLGGVDTRLTVFNGNCPGGLTQVVCNDDFCEFSPGSDPWASQVTFCATSSDTFFIEWDDRWDGSAFTWTLTETPASCSAPPDCPTLISPADGAIDVPLAPELVWSPAPTGGVPDSFEIFFGTVSGSLASLGLITDTSINIICLDFNTTYFWSIVAKNVNGSATGCTEFSFTTRAVPPAPTGAACITSGASAAFIFVEEFDVNPNGWTGDISTSPGLSGTWVFPETDTTSSVATGPSAAGSGTNYAYFEASGGTTATASLVSPAIDLSGALDAAELSFLLHAHGLGLGDFEVGIGASATGPFTPVFTWTDGQIQCNEAEAWISIGIDISSSIGSTIFVEFKQTGTGDFTGDMSIDLVRVETCLGCDAPEFDSAVLTSSCPGGFNVDVNVTDLGDGNPMFTDGTNFWPVAPGLNTLPPVGSFNSGDTVTITLLHGTDPACDIPVGTFTFTCPPGNNDCTGATSLSCGSSLFGETTNGSTGGNPNSCEGTIGDGVWYSILGTGDQITVTVTPVAMSWEAQVDVYVSSDGTCDTTSISCEAAASNTIGGPVMVSWVSVPGSTYYINVGPWINGDPGGDFDISVACSCSAPPTFTDSVDISTCPASLGIIVNVTSATGNVDISNNINGSMFANVPVGGPYTLTGFNSGDVVTVYVNNTGDPACVDSSVVNVNCPPANNSCAGAEVIMAMTPGTYSAVGTTFASDTAGAPPTCNGFTMNTVGGVWYEVQTDNQYDVSISTCNGTTSYDTKIGVYNGTCGGVVCIDANDDDFSCSFSTLRSTVDLMNGSFLSGGINGGIETHSPVTLLVYVTGFSTNEGDFQLDVVVSEVLPAELLDFRAYARDAANVIEWQTVSELNTAMHIVERSDAAAGVWIEVGSIIAVGESQTQKNYSLLDDAPLAHSFYRLKTVDRDGSHEYSSIVSVKRNEDKDLEVLRTFPVPARRVLMVDFVAPSNTVVDVSIIDLNGRVLSTESWPSTGQEQHSLDISGLASGLYYLRLADGKRQIIQKFVKE